MRWVVLLCLGLLGCARSSEEITIFPDQDEPVIIQPPVGPPLIVPDCPPHGRGQGKGPCR